MGGYVGFGLYRLSAGPGGPPKWTGDREAILVLVEGKARIAAARSLISANWASA